MKDTTMTKFDFNKLTLGEVAAIEDLGGQSIAMIAEDDTPVGKPLAAIAMVIKRRTGDPTFTFNQALAMPMDEATALLASDDGDEISGEADASELSATE